jgi:hypothetical protein
MAVRSRFSKQIDFADGLSCGPKGQMDTGNQEREQHQCRVMNRPNICRIFNGEARPMESNAPG